jgi:hypothetical protein
VRFAFIDAEKASYTITSLCKALDVFAVGNLTFVVMIMGERVMRAPTMRLVRRLRSRRKVVA